MINTESEERDEEIKEYKKPQALVLFLLNIIANPDITRDELIKKLQISKDKYYRYFKDLNRIIPIDYNDSIPHFTFPGRPADRELLGNPEMFKLFLILLHSLTVRHKIKDKAVANRLHRLLGLEEDIHNLTETIMEKEHDDDEALKKWALPLIEAIDKKRVVKILYKQEENKVFPLVLEPLKLIHAGEWWYLLALYKSEKNKNHAQKYYKLQRIEKLETLDRTFNAPKKLEIVNLSVPWDFGNGSPEEVVIKFSASVSRYIREKKIHPTRRLTECPDKGVVMSVNVLAPEKMLPWILSFGTEAEVIEPQSLRDLVAAEVQKLARMYP